jgi:bacteriocin-like protein
MEEKKTRIQIKDLPRDKTITDEEMKEIMGGGWIGQLWKWMGGGSSCDTGSSCGVCGVRS